MNRKKIILIILIGIMISGITLMYSSYTLFSANQINKSAITIKVGTMNGKIDGIITNKLTLEKGKKQTFVVTLENLNAIEGKFLPYYIGIIPDEVTFGYLEATGVDIPIETNLTKNGKKTYSIYLENNSNSSITINLGVQGGLVSQPLSLPTNTHMIPQSVGENKNISNIWKYDQRSGSSTFCVTGEESTCLPINPDTFEPGTIIKYKVNDTTEKYFHVMFDNGDTLTLQQRENTIYQTARYKESNDNTQGPTTILRVLENAPANWMNVNNQTYTLGLTIFKDNAFTGCTYDEITDKFTCVTNIYTMGERTGKSRMITVQEAHALGCLGFESDRSTTGTCPIWMYNYLYNSKLYGGTVSQRGEEFGSDYGYWTMNAYISDSTRAYCVYDTGRIGNQPTSVSSEGGRAVIMIKK